MRATLFLNQENVTYSKRVSIDSILNEMTKKVLVTVGTTKFEALIKTVSQNCVLDKLKLLGFTKIQFQTGTGEFEEKHHSELVINYCPYFDNFSDEIASSDLIISHAGAGTCLDVLKKEKPLIVVINEDLMDNHQLELAEQLGNDGYLYYCNCSSLSDTLDNDLTKLKLYPKVNKLTFSKYLDKCMGF